MIEIGKEADRDAVAVVLVRNGYTVRHVRRKSGKGNGYVHFIEFWK